MNRKLVLLDGNSITHRAFHALPPMDADGTPTNAVFGFFSMLLRALRDEQAEYLAVAFDPHGPTFRHAQYADYKAGPSAHARRFARAVSHLARNSAGHGRAHSFGGRL